MAGPKRLPSGGEFSPGQIDLHEVLSMISAGGTRKEIIESLRARYFAESCPDYHGIERLSQQSKRAGNVLISMQTYGLLEDTKLTDVGRKLLEAKPAEARSIFAAHILRNLGGFDVIDAIRTLKSKGISVSKASLSDELTRRGYTLPRATTHHLIMIKWLREAGVFGQGYVIDESILHEVSGLDSSQVSAALDLGKEQRDFLCAAVGMLDGDVKPLEVGRVLNHSQALFGTTFLEDRIKRTVVDPLEAGGWLTSVRGTRGRGAKSGTIMLSPQALAAFATNAGAFGADDGEGSIRAVRRRSMEEILHNMRSEDTHVKGVALEELAVRFCEFLRLNVRKWRLRSRDTGGAEVDVIADSDQLSFSRWQIQCKNTAVTHLEDAAKEVGVATAIRSHVIVLMTTGRATQACLEYTRHIARETTYQFIILDGLTLDAIAKSSSPASALADFLSLTAKDTLKLKIPQLDSIG